MTAQIKGGICHLRQLQKSLESYLSAFEFTKKLTKRQKVLTWLIVSSRAGYRVTRFDAEYIGDHVLPNAVRDIGLRDGLIISRHNVTIRTRFGFSHCCEYWLSDDLIERAEVYLMQFVIPRPER